MDPDRLTAVADGHGGWDVVDASGRVLAIFLTNAAAWRWIDRRAGSPISRAEVVADWIFYKD
jgi:hypothetical protein